MTQFEASRVPAHAAHDRHAAAERHHVVGVHSYVRPAYQLLHVAFVLVPLAAGIDKFFLAMAEWDAYLWPRIPATLGISARDFMLIVGAVEILAALIVLVKPSVGGWIVGAWLLGIVVNLALVGDYWDILLRDVGLALAAFALARLSLDPATWPPSRHRELERAAPDT